MTEEELDLVETEALIGALKRRSHAAIIAILHRVTNGENQGGECLEYWTKGGHHECLGVVESLHTQLRCDNVMLSHDIDPDDEDPGNDDWKNGKGL